MAGDHIVRVAGLRVAVCHCTPRLHRARRPPSLQGQLRPPTGTACARSSMPAYRDRTSCSLPRTVVRRGRLADAHVVALAVQAALVDGARTVVAGLAGRRADLDAVLREQLATVRR